MYILNETTSRTEYKRRWQIINRARGKGLNFDLVDAFYKKMTDKGYNHETTLAAVFYAAKCGVFGFVNTWKR